MSRHHNNTVLFIRYADFAPMFKAEMFDPDQWASIFKKAGAQCKPKLKPLDI